MNSAGKAADRSRILPFLRQILDAGIQSPNQKAKRSDCAYYERWPEVGSQPVSAVFCKILIKREPAFKPFKGEQFEKEQNREQQADRVCNEINYHLASRVSVYGVACEGR